MYYVDHNGHEDIDIESLLIHIHESIKKHNIPLTEPLKGTIKWLRGFKDLYEIDDYKRLKSLVFLFIHPDKKKLLQASPEGSKALEKCDNFIKEYLPKSIKDNLVVSVTSFFKRKCSVSNQHDIDSILADALSSSDVFQDASPPYIDAPVVTARETLATVGR